MLPFEPLEPRTLLTAVFPTDLEQYEVELINRARANPAAEAARDFVDLNEGLPAGTITIAPKQPLAINPNLTDSARGHSEWMITNDLFQHEGPGSKDPGDRMGDAGYSFTGSWTWGENIAYRSSKPSVPEPYATATQEHNDLFVDKGIEDRGHRTNMMSPSFREIGAGFATGDFNSYHALMLTTDFAASGSGRFLTGVAYADTVTHDSFYTPGEGLSAVTITATRLGDGAIFSTSTWSSGGYSLALASGQYIVRAAGGSLGGTVLTYGNVGIADQNVKCDFRPTDVGTVRGSVYLDTDLNGGFDDGEPGIGGVLVFIDAHRDGKRNHGELYARSNSGGAYAFRNLLPGNYRVREDTAGRTLTTPSAGFHTANLLAARTLGGRSFGNAPTGASPRDTSHRVIDLVDLSSP